MNPESRIPKKQASKTPTVSRDPDALLHTAEQVANHPLVKGSVGMVYAVKKAAKVSGDSPFSGRKTTARKFNAWILAHPEFVASHWLRKKKESAEPTSCATQPAAA